ncbi:MAG: DUF4416 family protein [Endomicrobium sp.]|uniref:DUF4416 family protein n=1 Tax=Candidatus Endomicrobiellum cubanum TaxID=3242325 RepID=UPI00281C26AE|nr:DUF4416 family protein [Endomicrobium sp.]MDR2396161.1 DUF4416 family protein [Endomicrobium sp.]
MGIIGSPKKVKLFCGIIFSNEKVKQDAFSVLENKFGKIDFISDIMLFDFSNYYNPEMGENLKRLWVSFEKLILSSQLAGIKVFTNSLEESFAINSKRQINIDPGYITPANVILATTKDYSHRIYLDSGIYGEVTTIYKKNGYTKLPWSYPDYLSDTATKFLLEARQSLIARLKEC